MTIKEVIVENIHGEKFVLNVFLNLASIRAIEKELKQMDKSYNFYKCLPMIDKGELSTFEIFSKNFDLETLKFV